MPTKTAEAQGVHRVKPVSLREKDERMLKKYCWLSPEFKRQTLEDWHDTPRRMDPKIIQ